MPTIPLIEQRTRASMAGLGPDPDSGVGVRALGDALMNNWDARKQIDAKNNAIEVESALSNLRMQSMERMVKAQEEAAEDAKDFTPGRMKDFDDLLSETTQNLNPKLRSIVKQESQKIRESLYGNALQFEARTRQSYRSSAFANSTDSHATAVELDPEQFDDALASQIATLADLGLPPEVRIAQEQRMREMLTEAAATGLARQSPEAVIAGLTKEKAGDPRLDDLTPAARDRVSRAATANMVQGKVDAILGAYEAGGPKQGSVALAGLKDSGLAPEVQAEIRSHVQAGVSDIRNQRREQYSDDFVTVERALGAGTAGGSTRNTVDKLYRAGALSESEYANYQGQIERVVKSRQEQHNKVATVESMLLSGQRLDPADSDAKKGVAAYFVAQQLQPGTPAYTNVAAALAARVNVVPEPAISWGRANLLSGDVEGATAAADLYARLEEANPVAFSYATDERSRALAGQVSEAVRAGTPAATAIEMARKNVSLPEAQRKALEDFYRLSNKGKIPKGNPEALRDMLNDDDRYDPKVFGGAPPVPLAMATDFDGAVERYFQLTGGDAETARKLAFKDITNKWGRTEVNGKPELMPYAPEQMYPGLSSEVIRQDISESVKASGQDVTSDVTLVPYEATGRSNGQLWRLGIVNEYGAPDLLRDDKNRPYTYRIPVDQQRFDQAQKALAEKKLEKAREDRGLVKELEANAGLGML